MYCSSENQLVDIFTKSFHVGHFETLRDKLGVCVAQIQEENVSELRDVVFVGLLFCFVKVLVFKSTSCYLCFSSQISYCFSSQISYWQRVLVGCRTKEFSYESLCFYSTSFLSICRFLFQFYFSLSISFHITTTSLFIYNNGGCTIHLLVYVDDIIITGNTKSATQDFIATFSYRFSIKDLGSLHYFLNVEVLPHQHGLFLSQRQYIRDLLTKTQMFGINPVATPLATSPALTLNIGSIISDPLEYHTVVGHLQYLSLTLPNIAYTVSKLSQIMHQLAIEHWGVFKWLLRYLSGTLDHGIVLYRHSPLMLHAFSDADWASNNDDFTSTGTFIVIPQIRGSR